MKMLKLAIKNAFRHKLRTILTITGISVAVIAFGLLRTVVTAWFVAVEASAVNRLVVRQAVSFIYPLPLSDLDKIVQVPGVKKVTYASWFQGVYKDKNQFFARFAVDADTFFDIYPEFELSKAELDIFKAEKNSCVVGLKIAKQYGLKIGDIITIDGDIYPGTWEFIVRGIYRPRHSSTDATQLLFHWDHLNERLKAESPERANYVGWYLVEIDNPNDAGNISKKIDDLFKDSPAPTKTETERAFTQNFLASTSAIVTSMNVMSFVIIGIIMLVLGNTMIMAARERTREYAVMKTLGFSAYHLTVLILGESLLISLAGGFIGLTATFPIVAAFEQELPKGFFPVFRIETITIILSVSSALLIGIVSAVFPIQKALRTTIVEGFRHIG